jgi:hypothetical protein
MLGNCEVTYLKLAAEYTKTYRKVQAKNVVPATFVKTIITWHDQTKADWHILIWTPTATKTLK